MPLDTGNHDTYWRALGLPGQLQWGMGWGWALSFSSCVILAELFSTPEPQFSHLQNGDDDSTSHGYGDDEMNQYVNSGQPLACPE